MIFASAFTLIVTVSSVTNPFALSVFSEIEAVTTGALLSMMNLFERYRFVFPASSLKETSNLFSSFNSSGTIQFHVYLSSIFSNGVGSITPGI